MSIPRGFSLFMLICLATTAFGEVIGIEDFDINNDNEISEQELRTFFLHLKSGSLHEIDSNRDGTIQDGELADHRRTLGPRIDSAIWEVRNTLNLDDPLRINPSQYDEVTELAIEPRIETSPKKPGLHGFLLRRSLDSNTIRVGTEGSDFSTSDGALFSYARNFVNDDKTWLARGALLYPFSPDFRPGAGPRTSPRLVDYTIVPSLSFDRISSSAEDSKELDNLTLRIGSELEIQNANASITTQYVRLGGFYATDFDFASEIVGLEAEWEPIFNNALFGIGVGRSSRFFENRLRLLLRSEYGQVLDVGNKQNLVDDEIFFRLGPRISFELWPHALQRLKLSTGFEYQLGLKGDPDSSRLFEAAASWNLDDSGHAALEVNYRKGDVPLTKEETETLIVGLSLKY